MLIGITIMLTCGAIVLASLYIKLNVGTVELWSCDSHSNCRYKQELRGTYNSNQEGKQMTSRNRGKGIKNKQNNIKSLVTRKL